MNTFNVGFTFGTEGFFIIVCASEDLIDRQEVQDVASKCLLKAMAAGCSPDRAIKSAAAAIRDECDCQAVIVKADVACRFFRK